MQAPDIALLGAAFFVGQLVFELNRYVSSRLAGVALRKIGKLRAVWGLLAILAIAAAVSLIVYGIMHWTWWKVILLWAGCGLIGSFVGKALWGRDEEGLMTTERLGHAFMVACAAFIWGRYFTT